MTKRLGDLSVDERRVEDIMKNHRLAKWGVGQTKALFIYDESQYDKERQELEDDAILESKLNAVDGVTDLQEVPKQDRSGIAARQQHDLSETAVGTRSK